MEYLSLVLIILFLSYIYVRYLRKFFGILKLNFQPAKYSQTEDIKLHYIKTEENDSIVASCPSISKGYSANLMWGKNGHLQTMYHLFVRSSPAIPFERIYIQNKNEEDPVAVDYFGGHDNQKITKDDTYDKPIVVIVPGIAGSSKQHYVKNFVHSCWTRKGWKSFVLNHRGCHQDLKYPSMFKFGDTSDLNALLHYVHDMYPSAPIFAVGYSMGANVLVKFAGEHNPSTSKLPIIGFASLCQGYDIMTTSKFLPAERPIYDYGLNLKLISVIKRHKHVFEKVKEIDIPSIVKTKSLIGFDVEYTLKVNASKFSSYEEYYRSQCCSHNIHKIAVPTLFLNALDDPIIPEHQIAPVFDICNKKNENIIMITTKHGGHLGFHENYSINLVPNRETFMDRVTVEYLDCLANKYANNDIVLKKQSSEYAQKRT